MTYRILQYILFPLNVMNRVCTVDKSWSLANTILKSSFIVIELNLNGYFQTLHYEIVCFL